MATNKRKLSADKLELFNRNFNREAYDKAKVPVQAVVSQAKSFEELWDGLQKYERDTDFHDDCTIISCEVELDRSHMETDGDYVGVCFYICWNDETNTGTFSDVALFTTETSKEYVADQLCFIDPDTCEITKWVYKKKSGPDIDDKQ